MSYSVFIDGHVHLHDFVSIHDFLSHACLNLRASANLPSGNRFRAFLCLADFYGSEGWSRLTARNSELNQEGWHLEWVDEFAISAEAESGDIFFIVAGRQIVTSEGLEIMGVGVAEPIPNGASFFQTLSEIKRRNGLAIALWGVGKWWGSRGRIIAETLDMTTDILYGDNGGRPWFWVPKLLTLAGKNGLAVIPGSDPLPIKSDCFRNGMYGFCAKGPIDENSHVSWLIKEMRGVSGDAARFGKTLSGTAFLFNQLQLRIK